MFRRSRWLNPPPAMLTLDNGNPTSRDLSYYLPETNPVINMISEQRFQSFIHLLDQTCFVTPPESENESASQKPEQIATVPEEVKSIEMDDSFLAETIKFLAEAKKKKILSLENTGVKKKNKKGKDKKKHRKPNKVLSSSSSVSSANELLDEAGSSARRSPRRPSPSRRSPSPDHHRLKSSRAHRSCSPSSFRSPSRSPSRRSERSRHISSRRRSHSKSPSRSPGRRASKSGNAFSKRRSPVSRSHSRSPMQRCTVGRSHSRSPKRRSSRYGHASSSRRRFSNSRSRSRSPSLRSRSGHASSRHVRSSRRSPESSSQKHVKGKKIELLKRYGTPSPERNSWRSSPSLGKYAHQKAPALSPYHSKYAGASQPSEASIVQPEKGVEGAKAPAVKPGGKKQPGKYAKIQVTDDYTKLLSEAMKEKNLVDYSDEDSTPILGVPLQNRGASDEESNPLSEDQENLVKYELGIMEPEEMLPDASFPQTKFFKAEDIKDEPLDQKGNFLESYYCVECQLSLNSEVTWNSHMAGKRHKKNLEKRTVHEVAKGSISVKRTPLNISEDVPRYADTPEGRRRNFIGGPCRLQPAIDDVRNRPLPGLDFIREYVSERSVSYYCELCDAQCEPATIMPHLIGYKHQLRFLQKIDPEYYERNKNRSKKSFEGSLLRIIRDHEKKHGRRSVQVYRETSDPKSSSYYSQPGPSCRYSPPPIVKKEKREDGKPDIPSNDDCLDTSKADFYCKLCDAHMNNINMWNQHVAGKRHLKNAVKNPGESISKVRTVRDPAAVSSLERLIDEEAPDELIVGLDYIRETQGANGDIYNCFLCGACCTKDIIDHLLLTKHRTKYLEELVRKGIPNGITIIAEMEMSYKNFRDNLIYEECRKMVEKYGPGRVEVHVTKN